MKKSNRFFLGMSALLLTFGLTMTMTGCGEDPVGPGGPTLYTVTFDVNGGTGAASSATVTQETEGAAITLSAQGTLAKSSNFFGGWNTNADGTGDNHAAGASYTPSGNVTLYAQWTTNPNISGKITLSITSDDVTAVSIQLKASDESNVGTAVHPASNGVYTITNVPAESYTIEVSLDGYETGTIESVTVTASANLPNKDITLKKLYKINGIIKTNAGAALAGVGVTLKAGTVASPGDAVGAEVLTDVEGKYSFSVVPGNYTLVLAAKSSGKNMPTASAGDNDITLGTQDYTHKVLASTD